MEPPQAPHRQPMLIIGASARAAAQSAARAGFAPHAADLFADIDLAALCPTVRVADYPEGFLQAAKMLPQGPWIYTGGLENYPALIDGIARERPLLGNAGNVLRRVRDPWMVRDALLGQGLSAAEVASPGNLPSTDDWLLKPRRSSAGLGIRPWQCGAPWSPAEHYLQRRLSGESHSAVFVGARGEAKLLGVTIQLTGKGGLAADQFVYFGSIGPRALASKERDQWRRIGDCLAAEFGLQGLFGVDAIVCGDAITPVEVNPRYTASVEIVERGFGISALDWHRHACQGVSMEEGPRSHLDMWGKVIIYAQAQSIISARLHDLYSDSTESWPSLADVPTVGEVIECGQPVVTVFSKGKSPRIVEADLRALANRVYERL